MSRTNSTGAFQGFSVVQPFVGASLQWLPALGTQELDEMINAFLPGPSSIQDKRAHISMDFFEFTRQTGETFKFYPVPSASSSPASSAALYDSGYASNFNVSPVTADSQWTESPATFTPVSFDETSVRSPASSSSKRPAASSSRQRTADFSGHPGMRIMTKDGLDVTNSASRGCKTKEQRDHAHLMRIIKACDACKRKKIRCDPSHKKRIASQASSASSEQKPSKKSKKKAADPPPTGINEFSLDFLSTESFEMPGLTDSFSYYENSSDNLDELWDQLVQQDPIVYGNDYLSYVPDDYNNLFPDQLSHVSPSSWSSTSPPQLYTPYTPTPPGPSPHTAVYETIPEIPQSEATLPYLNPDVPHGTDYVDFNLFSPPPDFSLDEEPQFVGSSISDGRQPPQWSVPRSPARGYELLNTSPPLSSGDIAQTDGILHSEPWNSRTWSSSGLTHNTQSVDLTPSLLQTTTHSTGDVRLDSPSLSGDVGGSQQSGDPGHHVVDRARPVLDSDGPYHGVPSAASRSEGGRVTVLSTVSASISRGSGQDTSGQAISIAPGLSVVTPSTSQVSSPRTSYSTPASSVMVPDSTGGSGALVNASSSVPALSSVQTIVQSSRRVGGNQASSRVSPSAIVQVVDSVDVVSSPDVVASALGSVLAHVSVPTTGQYSVSAGSGSLVYQSVVQHGVVAPSVDVVGPAVNAALATIILSTLPVQRILSGEATKPGQASSPSSLVYSQLVVFGLVSYLLTCLLDTQYLGSLPDLLSTLIIITTVSLGTLTAQNRRSVLESTKVMTGTTQSSTTPIDNVKSRIQAAGQRFYDFRCTVRQRAISFTRRIPLPCLASVQSLGRF